MDYNEISENLETKHFYKDSINYLESEIEKYKPKLDRWKFIKPDKRMLEMKGEYERILEKEKKLRNYAENLIPGLVSEFNKTTSRFKEKILKKFWEK